MAVPKKRASKAKKSISKCNKKISSYYSRLRLISDRRFDNQKKLRKLQDEKERENDNFRSLFLFFCGLLSF